MYLSWDMLVTEKKRSASTPMKYNFIIVNHQNSNYKNLILWQSLSPSCGPHVWWILFLVLLTTSASICLQHSRNLGPCSTIAEVVCSVAAPQAVCDRLSPQWGDCVKANKYTNVKKGWPYVAWTRHCGQSQPGNGFMQPYARRFNHSFTITAPPVMQFKRVRESLKTQHVGFTQPPHRIKGADVIHCGCGRGLEWINGWFFLLLSKTHSSKSRKFILRNDFDLLQKWSSNFEITSTHACRIR